MGRRERRDRPLCHSRLLPRAASTNSLLPSLVSANTTRLLKTGGCCRYPGDSRCTYCGLRSLARVAPRFRAAFTFPPTASYLQDTLNGCRSFCRSHLMLLPTLLKLSLFVLSQYRHNAAQVSYTCVAGPTLNTSCRSSPAVLFFSQSEAKAASIS